MEVSLHPLQPQVAHIPQFCTLNMRQRVNFESERHGSFSSCSDYHAGSTKQIVHTMCQLFTRYHSIWFPLWRVGDFAKSLRKYRSVIYSAKLTAPDQNNWSRGERVECECFEVSRWRKITIRLHDRLAMLMCWASVALRNAVQGCQFGFFEAKFVIFGLFSTPLAFFYFLKKAKWNLFFLAFSTESHFLYRFGRFKDDFGRFLALADF